MYQCWLPGITSIWHHYRAAFVELVGRGKVGLGLQAEQQRLVAIDGQQPMMGGPAAAARSSSAGSSSAVHDQAAAAAPSVDASSSGQPAAAELAPPAADGQHSAAPAPDGSNGSGADGSGVTPELSPARSGSEQQQRGPGSVVAVRLMTFARGWAAGTVAAAS